MTKIEYSKCVKLMQEAIRIGRKAEEISNKRNINKTEELIMIDAVSYARGINQALSVLNFKHQDMQILSKLI